MKVFWCALGCLLPLAALAQPALPDAVYVHVSECQGAESSRIIHALRRELVSDGVAHVSELEVADALAAIHVEGVCNGEAVRVVIEDRLTGKRVERPVALEDVPEPSHPRVVGLAAAELLRASWAELVMGTAPEPETPVPPAVLEAVATRVRARAFGALGLAPPPDPEGAPATEALPNTEAPAEWRSVLVAGEQRQVEGRAHAERQTGNGLSAPVERTSPREAQDFRIFVGGEASTRFYTDEGTWLSGLKARAQWRWLSVAAAALFGRDGSAIGHARVSLAELEAGVLPLTHAFSSWRIDGGAFLRAGYVRMRSFSALEGVRDESASGLQGALGLEGQLRRVLARAVLGIQFEFSYSLGIRGEADGEPFVSTHGVVFGAGLSVAWAGALSALQS